jgi:uncharacterized protein (DUF697 family)
MVKARALKNKADSVLTETFRSLFEEIDTKKLRSEIDELRQRSPLFDPIDHARTLARRTAVRCAAAGAVTGLPSGIFAVATLGADLAYLVFQQFRLILGIATIYGHEPTQKERFTEALTCLAYGSGIGLGKQGIATVIETVGPESALIVEKIGGRFIRDRLGRFVPLLGVVSGGAINYWAVYSVGKATIRYYEAKLDPELADEIWAEGDREHA